MERARGDALSRGGCVPLTDEQRARAERYLHLCGYAANKFARKYRCFARGEFLSAAFEGLADAVKNFDEGRGVSLDCYAPRRIDGACIDMLRAVGADGGVVRVSRGVRKEGHVRRVVSAETLCREEGCRFEFPSEDPPPDVAMDARERFESLLVGLSVVERFIIRKVYGREGWSLRMLGEHLELSPSRVGNIHRGAMDRIKERAFRQELGRPSEREVVEPFGKPKARRRKPEKPVDRRAYWRTPPALPFDPAELPSHLHELKPKLRRVVELRYGLVDGVEWTTTEIGREIGLTAPSVYHHLVSALKRFRQIPAKES